MRRRSGPFPAMQVTTADPTPSSDCRDDREQSERGCDRASGRTVGWDEMGSMAAVRRGRRRERCPGDAPESTGSARRMSRHCSTSASEATGADDFARSGGGAERARTPSCDNWVRSGRSGAITLLQRSRVARRPGATLRFPGRSAPSRTARSARPLNARSSRSTAVRPVWILPGRTVATVSDVISLPAGSKGKQIHDRYALKHQPCPVTWPWCCDGVPVTIEP